MLIAQGLTKYFGNLKAIDDVTFEAQKGEILGFLGPNAAGKTTTMRILTGYFPPEKGFAKIAGINILEDPNQAKRQIGYLPEHVPLYWDMPVDIYLNFVAEAKEVETVRRALEVSRVISLAHLDSVKKQYIGKLSRGFKQRVGLAQTLIGDPPVLILDEPSTGLDPKQRVEFRNLIKSFTGQKTVILSTHILSEAQAVCQRVIIINRGKIMAVDTPENLSNRFKQFDTIFAEIEGPSDLVTQALEEFSGILGVQRQLIEGNLYSYRIETHADLDLRKAISAFIIGQGWGLLEIRPMEINLEDIYIELMTEEKDENSEEVKK